MFYFPLSSTQDIYIQLIKESPVSLGTIPNYISNVALFAKGGSEVKVKWQEPFMAWLCESSLSLLLLWLRWSHPHAVCVTWLTICQSQGKWHKQRAQLSWHVTEPLTSADKSAWYNMTLKESPWTRGQVITTNLVFFLHHISADMTEPREPTSPWLEPVVVSPSLSHHVCRNDV